MIRSLRVLRLFLHILLASTWFYEVYATSSSSTGSNNDDPKGVDISLLFSTPEGRRGLDDMQLAPLIAASVAVFFGALYCFIGARTLRYAALGCAFFDGAFGTAALLEKILEYAQWEGVVSWIFFFLGGIFCCLIIVSIEHADVVCIGVTAGLISACTCMTTFGYLIAPSHPDVVLYTLMVILGLSVGWITFKTQPGSLIAATSWIGSNMITWGIGYFFGEYPNAARIEQFRRPTDGNYHLPSAWWGYFGGAVTLFLLGICIQAHTFDFERKPRRRRTHHLSRSDTTTLAELESGDHPPRIYVPVQTPSRHSRSPRSSHIV